MNYHAGTFKTRMLLLDFVCVPTFFITIIFNDSLLFVQVPNMMVTVLPVKKQQDNHNCGHFAVAFDIEILDSKSQIDAVFHVPQLRNQLTHCLESGALAPFPKI